MSRLGSLGGCSLAGSSLAGDTLGARAYVLEPLGATRGQAYVLEPLGDAERSDFAAYGTKVAATMIGQVSKLPPSMRSEVMRQAMNEIDPGLYARAEKFTSEARARGATPQDALAAGISKVVQEGLMDELAKLGKSKGTALGATSEGTLYRSVIGTSFVTAQPKTQDPSTFAVCPGFTWAGDHWEGLRAGQTPVPGPAPCSVSTVVHKAGEGAISSKSTIPEEERAAHMADLAKRQAELLKKREHLEVIQIGPFTFPLESGSTADHRTFTDEQQKWIKDHLATAMAAGRGFEGVESVLSASLRNAKYPIAKFKRPAREGDPFAGKMFGIYYQEKDFTTARGATIPGGYVTYHEYHPSPGLFSRIWNGIKQVAAKIVDVVEKIVDKAKDLTCKLISKQSVQDATAAGASTGNPYAVGVAIGTKVGANLCGGDKPPPQEDRQDEKKKAPSWLLPAAIAGGGLLILLSMQKRK